MDSVTEIKTYLKMLGVDFSHREDGTFTFYYPQFVMEVHEDNLHVSPILERIMYEEVK